MDDVKTEISARNGLVLWLARNIGGPDWIETALAAGQRYSDIQFFHQHTTAFEAGAEVLQAAGILDQDGRLQVPPERLEAQIADLPEHRVSLRDALSAFLQIADGYHGFGLETAYAVIFEPPAPFREVLDLLAQSGHLARRDGKLAWSEKAKPAFEDAYLWGEGVYSEVQEIRDKTAQLPGGIVAEIRSLIQSDKKIEAIALLRNSADLTAYLAKKAVDEELV